jgi:hypothetical protein
MIRHEQNRTSTRENAEFLPGLEAVDVKQVGRELGVRYVLEGSVRKGGGRVRITAQLINALTGAHLWADRYDRELTDSFAVQDEITGSVAAAIEPALAEAEQQRVSRKPPESLNAWEAYQRGLWHFYKYAADEKPTSVRSSSGFSASSKVVSHSTTVRNTFGGPRSQRTMAARKKKEAATGTASSRHALTAEFKRCFHQTGDYEHKRRRHGCPSHLWLASRSRPDSQTPGNRDFPVQSSHNRCSRFGVSGGLLRAQPSRVLRAQ